jgi:hypothetical protein
MTNQIATLNDWQTGEISTAEALYILTDGWKHDEVAAMDALRAHDPEVYDEQAESDWERRQ